MNREKPVGRCDACMKNGKLWKTVYTDLNVYTICKSCHESGNSVDYINRE